MGLRRWKVRFWLYYGQKFRPYRVGWCNGNSSSGSSLRNGTCHVVATLGSSNPPVALANLDVILYQVVDLEEARRSATYIQGTNPGIHGCGVATALGNGFHFYTALA